MADFNITNIVSHMSQNPLLTPNRYKVFVNGPVKVPEEVLFNCNRCAIPGQSLGTFDYTVVGPVRKIPNMEIYDDLSTSFYITDHIKEVDVMHRWMRLITRDGSFRIGYYNDIVSDMRIEIYDLPGKKTSTIKIYEAYPISISEVEMSYAGTVPAEVTITWAYHHFQIEVQDSGNQEFIF